MYNFEKIILCSFLRYFPETEKLGYLHVNTTLGFHNYDIHPNDFTFAPFPDLLLVLGRHATKQLQSIGYPTEKIVLCAGTRYDYLFKPKNNSEKDIDLIVPFSLDLGVAVELTELLIMFSLRNPSVKIVIKCHPFLTIKTILNSLGKQELPPGIEVSSETNLSNLIQHAKVMIYSGISNVPFDGLLSGCRVFHYIEKHKFPMDRLFPFFDDYVTDFETAEELEYNLSIRRSDSKLDPKKISKIRDMLFVETTEETLTPFYKNNLNGEQVISSSS